MLNIPGAQEGHQSNQAPTLACAARDDDDDDDDQAATNSFVTLGIISLVIFNGLHSVVYWSTGPSAGSSSSGGRESQVWPSVPQRRSSSLSASLMEVRERRTSPGTAAPSKMINVYYMYRMEAREHELLRAQAATHHVQGVRRVKHVPAMLSKGGHCTRERRALVQCGQMLRRVRASTHAHTLGFF